MVGYVSKAPTPRCWLPASRFRRTWGWCRGCAAAAACPRRPRAPPFGTCCRPSAPTRTPRRHRGLEENGGGTRLAGVYASAEVAPLHDTDVSARYRQGPGARDFDVRLRASEGAGPESSRLVEGSGLWSDRPGLAVEFSVRGLLTKGRWFVLRRSMRVGSDGELAYIPAPRTPAGRAYRIARDGYDAPPDARRP